MNIEYEEDVTYLKPIGDKNSPGDEGIACSSSLTSPKELQAGIRI
jgi:hypothetical protein